MYEICFTRYLNQITVRDIQTNQVWHFVCNDWLTPRYGVEGIVKTLNVNLNTGSNAYHFSLKLTQHLRNSHQMVSVWRPPPQSIFTRVQRLSCMMSFVMLAMMADIMLYGEPPAEIEDSARGLIFLNWKQLAIACQCLLICIPSSFIVVAMFTCVKPRIIMKSYRIRKFKVTRK